MTNWLNPKNMKLYIRHLKEIDDKVEKEIQKKLTVQHSKLIKSQRRRKYLRNLVLPE